MDHQNFQEAIAQLSTKEGMSSEEIKSHFNLSEEDMKSMQSYNPLIQEKAPQGVTQLCCCCWQSDS